MEQLVSGLTLTHVLLIVIGIAYVVIRVRGHQIQELQLELLQLHQKQDFDKAMKEQTDAVGRAADSGEKFNEALNKYNRRWHPTSDDDGNGH